MVAALPFYFGLAATAEPLVLTMLGDKWREAIPVVHLLALASYDLQRAPERVAIAEFLTEADRVATALREGKVVAGVKAARFVFEP